MSRFRDRINNSIKKPTISSLVTRVEACKTSELLSYYMVTEIDENLFSFLSGVVASFPVTVLFGLIELKVDDSFFSILKFCVYILIVLFSTLMSIKIFKFTLLHIKINHYAENEPNKEIYRNKIAEVFISNSKKLTSALIEFIVYTFVFVLLMIIQFIITNMI